MVVPTARPALFATGMLSILAYACELWHVRRCLGELWRANSVGV
jgi:hypothetical protein